MISNKDLDHLITVTIVICTLPGDTGITSSDPPLFSGDGSGGVSWVRRERPNLSYDVKYENFGPPPAAENSVFLL